MRLIVNRQQKWDTIGEIVNGRFKACSYSLKEVNIIDEQLFTMLPKAQSGILK